MKIKFYSLPKETIATCDEMAAVFLVKYLPPAKVSKLWSDIITFTQLDDESIHNAWERYKASNHRLPPWLEIQFFYNGLQPYTKMIINVAAGGSLMSKNLEEARDLLDKMSTNHYQCQSTRGPAKKIVGVHEIDTLSVIQAQLAVITKRLGAAIVSSIQTISSCDFCGGDHDNNNCQAGNSFAFEQNEQVNYINNYQRPNKPYSNTNNPRWRNHQNLQ